MFFKKFSNRIKPGFLRFFRQSAHRKNIQQIAAYFNEREVGRAVHKSGIPREELFITTKLYRPSSSYERAKAGIEASLRDMNLDYLDLVLIHEPYPHSQDMYKAMKEAYQEGKIRAIGISNFNQRLYRSFIETCGLIPAVNQVEAHVFFQQDELQAVMLEKGTQMQAWSPFAAGKQKIFSNETLKSIGMQYGKTAAQAALRYLIQRGISVIPKSSHRQRMIENMDIFDFRLTDQDLMKIHALDNGKTLFGWYE